ncbi:hypothetical protein ACFFK0_16465 [Paenibacillus chartarius]|uniref:Beta-lactamase-related domain-containing protein n=1 Tax=Paenibacillus chartarius TaxID=747481 RepID=A0ABV6DMZ7_9BACL
MDYGYGWQLQQDAEYGKIVSHGGSWPGFSAALIRYIDRNALIVYMSNAPETPEVEQSIILALENILFGKPFELPVRVELPTFIQVPAERLTAYAGTYALDNGVRIYVRTEGEMAYLQVEGQNRFPLQAISETEFRIRGVPGVVRFEGNKAAPETLVIVQGQELVALRTETEC